MYNVVAKYANVTDHYMPIGLGIMASDGTISYFMNMYTFAVRIVYSADGNVLIESGPGNAGLTV